MALYRKKPITIEATQWFKDGDHQKVMMAVKRPDGVIFCHNQICDELGYLALTKMIQHPLINSV